MKIAARDAVVLAVLAVLVGVILIVGWFFWGSKPDPLDSETPVPPNAGSVPGSTVAQLPAQPASTPSTMVQLPADKAALTSDRISAGLDELLGRPAALRFLQPQDFARRVVATVDNLGRERATPKLWPVNPTGRRFTVQQQEGAAVNAPANEQRYDALVQLLEPVDTNSILALYARIYPLLQEACEGICTRRCQPARPSARPDRA